MDIEFEKSPRFDFILDHIRQRQRVRVLEREFPSIDTGRQDCCMNSTPECGLRAYIENTSWKVLAYGIYARVVDVSEILLVRCAHSFDF